MQEEVPILSFWLPGRVVPKARPRFVSKHAYTPSNYRLWKSKAICAIALQLEGNTVPLPLPKVAVHLIFVGKQGKSDIDNLAGAVLDSLTQSSPKVLNDDNLSCIPELVARHQPKGMAGCIVRLYKR